MIKHLFLLVVLGLCGLQACAPWRRGPDPGERLAKAMDELAQVAARLEGDEEVAMLGFRNEEGERSTATEILDEYLISALVQVGVPLVLVEEAGYKKWGEGEVVPASEFEDLSAPWVLAGRLQDQANWVYPQLFVIERASGILVGSGTRRLAGEDLQRKIDERSKQEPGQAPGPARVDVDLHLLGLHSEGGFDEQIALAGGVVLEPEDRLQIRFKTGSDCQVWGFLYSSEGEREEVFASQMVYGGRWHYGPGEEDWITVGESGKVYTLYLIAAEHLGEDWEELFENMAKLISEGEVDRFRGLEKQDQALVAFLTSRMGEGGEIRVLRSVGEEQLGERERFILESGISLSSRAEKLGPSPVVVRAFSFEVQ